MAIKRNELLADKICKLMNEGHLIERDKRIKYLSQGVSYDRSVWYVRDISEYHFTIENDNKYKVDFNIDRESENYIKISTKTINIESKNYCVRKNTLDIDQYILKDLKRIYRLEKVIFYLGVINNSYDYPFYNEFIEECRVEHENIKNKVMDKYSIDEVNELANLLKVRIFVKRKCDYRYTMDNDIERMADYILADKSMVDLIEGRRSISLNERNIFKLTTSSIGYFRNRVFNKYALSDCIEEDIYKCYTEEEAKIIIEYTRITNGMKVIEYLDVDEKI